MALCELTIAELDAQADAMGEGWWYDSSDHTFNWNKRWRGKKWPSRGLDADTLEELPRPWKTAKVYRERKVLVREGLLGAPDKWR